MRAKHTSEPNFGLFLEPPTTVDSNPGSEARDFVPTPGWFAKALCDRYLNDIRDDEYVLEPCAGAGAILKAIEAPLAYGIEIDAALAEEARLRSGRDVITGDCLKIRLPHQPTHIITNPPFRVDWLNRATDVFFGQLPDNGRGTITLLLPAYALQTSIRVCRYIEKYSMNVEMIPRDIFEGFDKPLVIAQFRKEHVRRLHGMAFYQEIADERGFPEEFRAILSRAERNVWVAACVRALEHLGGTGSVDQITRVISGARPTRTEHWREAVRKHLRQFFPRLEHGVYALPTTA